MGGEFFGFRTAILLVRECGGLSVYGVPFIILLPLSSALQSGIGCYMLFGSNAGL